MHVNQLHESAASLTLARSHDDPTHTHRGIGMSTTQEGIHPDAPPHSHVPI
jgi:hypothetical protein